MIRTAGGLAAIVAVAALIGSGLLAHRSPIAAEPAPPGRVEAFSRIDAGTAWAAAGSDLYITKDGGATWSKGSIPGRQSIGQSQSAETSADHYYPTFVDADHGWLVSWQDGDPSGTAAPSVTLTVHRTSDGGRSWTASRVPGAFGGIGTVQFIDRQHGWLTVYQVEIPASPTVIDPLASGAGGAASEGIGVSTQILATSDGGVTWSLASTFPVAAAIRATSATEVWGQTHDLGPGASTLIHSTDGGRTWLSSRPPLLDNCSQAVFADVPTRNAEGLSIEATCTPVSTADGSSPGTQVVTFASADEGRTWTHRATADVDCFITSSSAGYSTFVETPLGQPIVCDDTSSGVDSGSDWTPQASSLRATFDGGATWQFYPTAGLPGRVSMAQWESPDDVWLTVGADSGLGGYLYRSGDGGRTWHAMLGAPSWPTSAWPAPTSPVATEEPTAPVMPPPMTSIGQVGRLGPLVGWIVLYDPTAGMQVRLTTDGGTTWSEPRSVPGDYLSFADAEHGWSLVAGDASDEVTVLVFRTVDGGRTWQSRQLDLGPNPGTLDSPTGRAASFALHFRDRLHGELIANFGAGPADTWPAETPAPSPGKQTCERLSTADGGATWSKPVPAPCMQNITFVDATFGYAGGWQPGSRVYVTIDGGRSWTEGAMPVPAGGGPGFFSWVSLMERRNDGSLRAVVSWSNGPLVTSVATSRDGGRTWTTAVANVQALNSIGGPLAVRGPGRWLGVAPAPMSPDGIGPSPATTQLLFTDDGGATWTSRAVSGLPGSINAVAFVSPTDGWLAGSDLVCVTDNGGQSCATGQAYLKATTDGGATWRTIFTP